MLAQAVGKMQVRPFRFDVRGFLSAELDRWFWRHLSPGRHAPGRGARHESLVLSIESVLGAWESLVLL